MGHRKKQIENKERERERRGWQPPWWWLLVAVAMASALAGSKREKCGTRLVRVFK